MEKIANNYADAQLTAIIEELALVGLELSEMTEKVGVIKVALGTDGEGVKKLEALVGRIKQCEINLWRDIGSPV